MTAPTIPQALHLCPTCSDIAWGGDGRDCDQCALHKAECAALVRVIAKEKARQAARRPARPRHALDDWRAAHGSPAAGKGLGLALAGVVTVMCGAGALAYLGATFCRYLLTALVR